MTITLTREEAQQVLDAFESATPKYTRARKDGKTLGGALDYWKLEQHKRMPALAILRARLSAPEDIYEEGCTPADFRVLREANERMAHELFELKQPEPKPEAWISKDRCIVEVSIMSEEYMRNKGFEPLYTAPPQRNEQEPAGWIYEDDEGRMMFSQMPQNPPLWEPVYKINSKEKNT
jgi:hypothetical protein